MRVIRRTQIGAAAAAVALSGVLFAPAAVAATPAQAASVAPAQYGAGDQFSVTLSSSVVTQGAQFTVTITGVPSRAYSVVVFSAPIALGTKVADASGKVSFTFSTATLDVGDHHVEVTDTVTGKVVTAYFSVAPASGSNSGNNGNVGNNANVGNNNAGNNNAGNNGAGSSNNAGGSKGGGGGLAFTGSDAVVPMSILGVVLVGGGAAAVVAGRNRRSTPDA